MAAMITHFTSTRRCRVDARPVHLIWSTDGASKVWLEEPYIKTLTKTGVLKVFPEKNTSYTLCASGNGREEQKQVLIKVNIPPPQILYFFLKPALAKRGEEVSIHWKVIGEGKVSLSFGKHRSALAGEYRFRAFSEKTFSILLKKRNGDIEKQEVDIKLCKNKQESLDLNFHASPLVEINGNDHEVLTLIETKCNIPHVDRPSLMERFFLLKWFNQLLNN